MRGKQREQRTLLMVGSLEERIAKGHPIRRIKDLADGALTQLSEVFEEMYAATGRPSVPPERLLKSQLLMALFSVRSDRQFCEQLDYNLLFRWFLDMEMDEASFDPSTFTRNRERRSLMPQQVR
jgi:transposase